MFKYFMEGLKSRTTLRVGGLTCTLCALLCLIFAFFGFLIPEIKLLTAIGWSCGAITFAGISITCNGCLEYTGIGASSE